MTPPPPPTVARREGGSWPGKPARGRGGSQERPGRGLRCGGTHTPGPPRRSSELPTPAGTPLPSSGFNVPDSPPSPPWARGQSQAELGCSASPIVFSVRQSRRSPPTERRILGGSRPRGSSPPSPRRFVNQSEDGDRLSLLPLASCAVNQRSALPLGLRFRPSPRRSAPIGGAVTPSRVLLLREAAHQAASRGGLAGDKVSRRLLATAPASRVRIGQEAVERRVTQGGARTAPEEEDGAVRGSEPLPPLQPVCVGPRRGRAR